MRPTEMAKLYIVSSWQPTRNTLMICLCVCVCEGEDGRWDVLRNVLVMGVAESRKRKSDRTS